MNNKYLLLIVIILFLFFPASIIAGPASTNKTNSHTVYQTNQNYTISNNRISSPSIQDISALLSHAGIPIENLHPSKLEGNLPSPLTEGDYLWHTFYGSVDTDFGIAITTDKVGGVYIVGESYASWNGPAGQLPLHSYTGGIDIVVIKLDTTGTYKWHTFYGSTGGDIGWGIVLDNNGGLFITGFSRGTWNGPLGQSPLHAYSGDWDITILKLDDSGVYKWHTFYGSENYDQGYGISIDNLGGVYITRESQASWNGPSGEPPLHPYSGSYDIFVLKLNSDGVYQWHTFYGSESLDLGFGITSDNNGGIYLVGASYYSWNGPSGQAPLHAHSGNTDIVVIRLNASGAYQWHTFYGSTGSDSGLGIATDQSNGLYITGNSSGSWNGPSDIPPLHNYTNGDDVVVLKLNGAGAYQWHTFYGSVDGDAGNSIIVDNVGGVYISGLSYSLWKGPGGQQPLHTYTGGIDIVVLKLNTTGDYQWHTFFGSMNEDRGYGITKDGIGGLYITGHSYDSWNGPSGQAPLHPNSRYDIAVIKLQISGTSFSISGQVTDSIGNPVPNVYVSASQSYSSITDNQGNYLISNVSAGIYAVVPSLSGYTFTPFQREVTVPPDATGVDFTAIPLQIADVEINQGLGNPSQPVQLYVAGKDTAIRVFLNSPVYVNPLNQQVVVKRYGIPVATLEPQWQPQPTNVLTFLCYRARCDNWQAGNYIIEATVSGVSSQASVVFQDQKTLRILAVPIIVDDRGVIKYLPDPQWMTSWYFLNTLYPIASDSVTWDPGSELEAKWPGGGWFDLTKESDRKNLIVLLRLRNAVECARHLQCYDGVIGFIPPMPIDNGRNFGWDDGNNIAVVMANGTFTYTVGTETKSFKIDFMDAVTAHEMAHNFKVGDEYDKACGQFQCNINPPPKTYFGSQWGGGACNKSCLNSDSEAWFDPLDPLHLATGSRVVAGIDDPYDIVHCRALPDMLSIMGSGLKQENFWITPDIYNHIFSDTTPTQAVEQVATSIGRLINASGWISQDDSLSIEPWYTYTDTVPATFSGTYTIQAVDALSNTLASQGFEVSFYLLSDPPELIDPAMFQVAAPFPQGTTAFRILHDGTVLGVVPISPNTPEMTVVYPNGGESWGANETQTVSWTGSDADGDNLTYTVLYTPDSIKWITLGTMITTTQLSINTGQIPGGSSARIEVIATDGINTSSDTSNGVFSVGKKAPKAYILSPEDNTTLPFGASFFLHGYAYDLEDGKLADPVYQWSSDKDGYLGEGKLILVDLSFGNHIISLIVTDSDGNTSTETIHVFVGNRIFLPLTMKR